MKVLKFLILSFFITSVAYSQAPYSPIKTPIIWSKGGFDSLFLPAHDTLPPKDKTKAWMTLKDTTLYVWKGNKWVGVSGAPGAPGGGSDANNTGTIAQLRALNTAAGKLYFSTDRGGGNWLDIGPKADDDYRVDDGATLLLTANNRWIQRQISDRVNVTWFGAKGDNSTNNIAAFNAAVAYLKVSNLSVKKLYIPTGNYIINSHVVFDAGADNIGIRIEGDGEYASNIILANSSTDTTVVQFGSANSNSLGGGIKDIGIVGKPTADGLIVASSAPYAAAWNIFENVRLYNCRDFVNYKMNPSNETSCFRNIYRNIHGAIYSRIGFTANGAYNDHYGIFITQPNGEVNTTSPDPTKGAANLALKIIGSNQNFYSCQFEDQIYNLGSNCLLDGITVENMLKGQPHPLCGTSVFVNAGTGINVRNFRGITLNHTINTLMTMYAPNTSLDNISYSNPGNDAQFQLTYPIMLGGGSGKITNSNVPAALMQNSFTDPNWGMENVMGASGLFTTPAHLTTTLTNVMSNSNVTNLKPYFRRGLYVGNYNDPDTVSVEGALKFRVLDQPMAVIKENHIDASSGGISVGYIESGVNKDGIVLDYHGNTWHSGRVSGDRALQDTEYVPRGQVTDTLNARQQANTFIIRNSQGTGDTTTRLIGTNTLVHKTISVTGSQVTKVVTDTTIAYTVGGSSVKVLPNANYTILSTDYVLILTEVANNRTITLPAASTMPNKEINLSVRASTVGRWLLSGSFVQKNTTGVDPIAENFVNSGLPNGVNYRLVSDGVKWYDIAN